MYQPPPQLQQGTGTDGFAIAALVLGIIPFLTVVLGVIFGIISLSRIRGSYRSGRGMAIAGIVTGSLWIAVFVAVGATGGFADDSYDSYSDTSSFPASVDPDPADESTLAMDLRVGDCLSALPTGRYSPVVLTPCSDGHVAEVFDVGDLAGTEYPGDEHAVALATAQCNRRVAAFVGVPAGNPTGYKVLQLAPKQQDWATEPTAICLITTPKGEELFGGASGLGRYGPVPAGEEVGTVSSDDLQIGNCVATLPKTGTISTLDLVPCTKPHDGEVYSQYPFKVASFPGASRADDLVTGHCQKWLPIWAGAPAGRTGYDLYYLVPTAGSWKAGDHTGTCILTDDNGAKLTGPSKGKGRHR
jgi:hypothetical protein